MKGNLQQAPQQKPFGIQDQMTATNQQALPVPYIAGTRKIALTWDSPVYNLRTAPAPTNGSDRPNKK